MSAVATLFSQAQKCLAPFYLLYGEEDVLRIEALDGLRNIAKKQGFEQKEQFYVEGTSFDWTQIADSMQSMGLFSEKKLIEIHVPNGKLGKEGGAAIRDLLSLGSQDMSVILLLPKLDKTQQNSAWFKAWQKEAILFEAKAVDIKALPAWIGGRLSQYKLSIEKDALNAFVDKVEGNLLAAKQEIDKLALLYPEGSQLNMADVQNTIANVARFDVFQLAHAWMSGNGANVWRLSQGLAQEGEEPVLLLWAVSEDIRTLIKLKAGLSKNTPQRELTQTLRLWGNKQQDAFVAAKRLSVTRLMQALQICALVDRQIKGAESGDAWECLQALLLDLSS